MQEIGLRTLLIFTTIILTAGLEYLGVKTISRLTRTKIITLTIIGMAVYGLLVLNQVNNLWTSNISIIMVSVGIGSTLGTLLNHEVSIMVFLIVSSISDVFSFFKGFTAALNTQHLNGGVSYLRYLAITLSFNGLTQWIVGIGDLVIISTAAFALKKLGYSDWISFLVPLSGLLTGVIFALFIKQGIPAIPFIATTVIVYLRFQQGHSLIIQTRNLSD